MGLGDKSHHFRRKDSTPEIGRKTNSKKQRCFHVNIPKDRKKAGIKAKGEMTWTKFALYCVSTARKLEVTRCHYSILGQTLVPCATRGGATSVSFSSSEKPQTLSTLTTSSS